MFVKRKAMLLALVALLMLILGTTGLALAGGGGLVGSAALVDEYGNPIPDPPPEEPTDPAPTDPPEDPAPTDPPADPEPTDPPADPAPTDPPAEPEPTDPPADPLPTDPPDPSVPDEGDLEDEPSYRNHGDRVSDVARNRDARATRNNGSGENHGSAVRDAAHDRGDGGDAQASGSR